MRKIFTTSIVLVSFLNCYGQLKNEKVYINIISILNRPDKKYDKRVYYEIVNLNDEDIKIILDPNILKGNKDYQLFGSDVDEKLKVNQVKAMIYDSENKLIITQHAALPSRMNDALVENDPKRYVRENTLTIKACSKVQLSVTIPIADNCSHCKLKLVFADSYIIKPNEFYKLQISINPKEILEKYPDAIDHVDRYYWSQIDSELFVFKNQIRSDNDGYDIDEYIF
ncbi:hypothetical protein [Chryseobacterium foetidum]|uniref:hypothetical protein n=1 Tax=Chryseobacterium foetidum TaxID=2951057 RepID=UPI0021C8AEC2|nr:hypothetical protein [Chryseobacterium foetidum]